MHRTISTISRIRLTAAACAFSALFLSCAGQARVARDRPPVAERTAERDGEGVAVAKPTAADIREETTRRVAEALSKARLGQAKAAFKDVAEALKEAGNSFAVSGLKTAKVWTLLFDGSREAALEAFREAAADGSISASAASILEFRIAALDDAEAARKSARSARRTAKIDKTAEEALSVMTGDKDIRDIAIESPEAADEYATYLAGYTLAPNEPVKESDEAEGSSTIVVRDLKSVNADEATLAVARIAYRDALAKRKRFKVVDAESRKSAVEELELSLAGAAAGDGDKAVGELFAADYVAAGTVVKTDSSWLIAYTLSSAKDGSIVASDFTAVADHAAVIAAAGRFAQSLEGVPLQ